MPKNDAARAIAAFQTHPAVLPLRGAVQHYDWGGYTFIPDLLGIDNSAREPYAELWIGAHPGAPSTTEVDGASVPLNQLIESAPVKILGAEDAKRFADKLPYLFKVLDARKMLSIQAHPTKQQAEEGYVRENAEGIPPKAPNRNYKDDNHKPEVHVALTDFWMLHGFRPLEEISSVLRSVPELSTIMPDFAGRLEKAGTDKTARRGLLRSLYETAMTMPQEQVDAILNPLLARLNREVPTDKDAPDFWARRAAQEFPLPEGHRDRGIFSVYLLNLVHLVPGQGTYQPAGMLHAYLEGVNMELMANSDNVLRGGLTPKHVDVPELMRILSFEGGHTNVLNGEDASPTERVYHTPSEEFELSRIRLDGDAAYSAAPEHGPDAFIVLDGTARLEAGGASCDLERGKIAFAPHGIPYTLRASGGAATVFKASIPKR